MRDPVFDIFCEEAREHVAALEQGFLDLEAAASVEARRPIINHVFRHVHSLKGDARAIGLSALQGASQSLEDLHSPFLGTSRRSYSCRWLILFIGLTSFISA